MIAAFGRGVMEFVVGDDWRAAAGAATALALTALAQAVGLAAWWITPVAAVAILYLSVRRAVPRRESPPPDTAGDNPAVTTAAGPEP